MTGTLEIDRFNMSAYLRAYYVMNWAKTLKITLLDKNYDVFGIIGFGYAGDYAYYLQKHGAYCRLTPMTTNHGVTISYSAPTITITNNNSNTDYNGMVWSGSPLTLQYIPA